MVPKLAQAEQRRSAVGGGVDARRRFDKMALLVIGGEGRHAEMRAIGATYGRHFRHRVFVDDVDPDAGALGADVAADTVNVFPGLAPNSQALYRAAIHPNSSFWQGKAAVTGHLIAAWDTPEWLVSQAKYLLGLAVIKERYPAVDWYIVVDSDTFVYPYRLGVGLDLFGGRNPEERVALGHVYRVRPGNGIMPFNIFLGGAGTVLSRGAVQGMNVTRCVEHQLHDKRWNQMASDWRMGYCMLNYMVRKVNVLPMYQSNDRFGCREGQKDCSWSGAYLHVMSPCALTFHYMTPEDMQRLYERDIAGNATTCVPTDWLRTTDCTCHPLGPATPDSDDPLKFGSLYQLKNGGTS